MSRNALLIGIQHYGQGIESVDAAPWDVCAVQAVLCHKTIGYFDQIHVVTDSPKGYGAAARVNDNGSCSQDGLDTRNDNHHGNTSSQTSTQVIHHADLGELIQGWCLGQEVDDLTLLFISGRGFRSPAGALYFATSNTYMEANRLVDATAIPAYSLAQWLDQSPSRQQVVVLDCCFDDFSGRPAMAGQDYLALAEQLAATHRVVLSASTVANYWADQKGDRAMPLPDANCHSLYTYYWVDGLNTGAADVEGRQGISVADLHHYITRQMAIATPSITPLMVDPGNIAPTLILAKSQITEAQRQYYQLAEFHRSGSQISPVGRHILAVQRQQSGLSAECARMIEQQVLYPTLCYHDRLKQYQHQAAKLLDQQDFAQWHQSLVTQRRKLGLRPEDVAAIDHELAYLQQMRHMQRYRETLQQAIATEYPLSAPTQAALKQLQQMLALEDQDIKWIEQEVMADHNTRHQRLIYYRYHYRQALERKLASPLLREELNLLRQQLGLSHDEIDIAESAERDMVNEIAVDEVVVTEAAVDAATVDAGAVDEVVVTEAAVDAATVDETAVDAAAVDEVVVAEAAIDAATVDETVVDDVMVDEVMVDDVMVDDVDEAVVPETVDSSKAVATEAKSSFVPESSATEPLPSTSVLAASMEVSDSAMVASYELALRAALARRIPLEEGDRQTLAHLQQALKLSDYQVRAIHQRMKTEIEQQEVHYHQNQVRQYEQQFVTLLEPDGTLSPTNHAILKQLQIQLGLKDTDVQIVEKQAQQYIIHHPDQTSYASIPVTTLDTSLDDPQRRTMPPAPAANSPSSAQTMEDGMPQAAYSEGNGAIAESVPQTADLEASKTILEDNSAEKTSLPDFSIIVGDSKVKYNLLKTYLDNAEWRQADGETLTIMLTATIEPVSWMSRDAIKKLPCKHLETLDYLWHQYSHGRFGFSVQHSIFQTVEPGPQQIIRFGKKVGWTLLDREFVGFKSYNQLTFDPSSANIPVGHFPARWFWQIPWWESFRSGGLGTGRWGCGDDAPEMLLTMMRRFDVCDEDDGV